MSAIAQQIIDQQAALINARKKMQGNDAHCFETVHILNGIDWINHSMATSVVLTWHALRDVNGPVVLIIGGTDRADDHAKLADLIREKVTAIVCLGTTPWKYVQAFSGCAHLIVRATYIQEAVATARLLCNSETKTVLFAPGCPSYDAFDNYKNRGNSFREAVKSEFGIK